MAFAIGRCLKAKRKVEYYIKMKPIKLYWSASKKNVGDWLSPLIVGAQTKRSIEHAKANDCELMSIGSILHKAKSRLWSPAIDVWGSGLIRDQAPKKTKHRIHAVRGKLTRDRVKAGNDVAVGDPGLLIAKVLPQYEATEKKYSIGLIPHYEDQTDPQVERFIAKNPSVKLLNILNDVEVFVKELTECEFILSSSLHGLIMSDAYSIPNQWLVLSDKVEGNNFKFHDYYSVFDMESPEYTDLDSLNLERIAGIKSNYSRPGLHEVQQSLIDAFPAELK